MSARNTLARRPPMGWNSYDCYGDRITEADFRANARRLAEQLLPFGYEYAVIDCGWYWIKPPVLKTGELGEQTLDGFGRQIPASERFPSAANGVGFKPLADHVHSLGLKFGLHLMRGIPRPALDRRLPVKGAPVTAADVGNPKSACEWLTDMYGARMLKYGAQQYYDSVFAQFAEWGVDFVKFDDSNDPYYAAEIEAADLARRRCGRDIVLSLSPGGVVNPDNLHAREHSEMWRITADVLDDWSLLRDMFVRARLWTHQIGPGHWPDLDMIPLGRLGDGKAPARDTAYSRDEQRCHLGLLIIFRSPLMIGSDLPQLDPYGLSLLTNKEALAVNQEGLNPRELFARNDIVAWISDVPECGDKYLALFNLGESPARAAVRFADLGLPERCAARDIWERRDLGVSAGEFTPALNPHAGELYRIARA